MQEIISYLLILIAWHPDHPGKFDVRRYPALFKSIEECQLYGEDALAKHDIHKEFFPDKQISYHCVAGPLDEEIDQALQDRKEREKENGQ